MGDPFAAEILTRWKHRGRAGVRKFEHPGRGRDSSCTVTEQDQLREQFHAGRAYREPGERHGGDSREAGRTAHQSVLR